MNYYIEVTLLSNEEIPLHFIWQKVYQQLHLALAKNKISEHESAIGISFPKYGDEPFPLGDKLRLFAQTEEQLQKFDVGKWLNCLTDYTHYTSIREVPSGVDAFVCFKRKQFKTNVERLARRRVKRKEETFEQAMKHFDDFKDQESKLPFVYMTSLSTGKDTVPPERKKFRLFIEKVDAEKAQAGTFNCYGLSSRDSDKQATVPWF